MKKLHLIVVSLFIVVLGCTKTNNNGGTISTVAGNGTSGFSGDGGPVVSAEINSPQGIAIDKSGNIYFTDVGNFRIRKISSSGIITTIAGNGTSGFSGDGGPAIEAELGWPSEIALDKAGNIYFTDSYNNRIRKISFEGIITTIAGNGMANVSGDGGPALNAGLLSPQGITLDASGNIYFTNGGPSIRKISTSGIITTIAGTGEFGFSGDGGPATAALLTGPLALIFDDSGNLFFTDVERIRKISTTGIITTIAGIGTVGFSGDDGTATFAQLYNPNGIVPDGSGNIYFTDLGNNRIRKISSAGIITTIAGNGYGGFRGDGGPAISAELYGPGGITIDLFGNIYFSDFYNNRIRKISN
jgi:trimeric autotransporter adhesin